MDWDRDREMKDRQGMCGWVGIRIGQRDKRECKDVLRIE